MTVGWRSMLFAPANRADLVAKLPRTGADVVVVDLEDGVPAAAKSDARAMLASSLAGTCSMAAARVFVRTNAVVSGEFDADIAACGDQPIGGVVVPKVEHPDQVRLVRDAVPAGWKVVVGLETAAGVHHAVDIMGAGAHSCYFGAEDYIGDLGGVRTVGGREVLYARSQVALAARLAGVPAFDQAVVQLGDLELFRSDAREGRAMGYTGKLCIHPSQVAPANSCFSVSSEQRMWAARVLAAVAEVASRGHGTLVVDGQMIDEPMIRRARQWSAAATEERNNEDER